jgi:hypothetical protein
MRVIQRALKKLAIAAGVPVPDRLKGLGSDPAI